MSKDQSWIADLLAGVSVVQSNGAALPQRKTINFVPGLPAPVDNPNNNSTDVPLGGGGGGGGTTTLGAFTEPAFGATAAVTVADPTVVAKSQPATIAGVPYLVTNITGSTVTFLNADVNNPTGSVIASGAKVAFGGASVAQAAVAPLKGQALVVDPTTGKLTPTGHRPHINLASLPGFDPTGAVNIQQELVLEAAAALSSTPGTAFTGLPVFIPSGGYKSSRPVFLTNCQGIEIFGPKAAGLYDSHGANISAYGTWDGPTIIMGNEQADPVFAQDPSDTNHEWMMTLGFPAALGTTDTTCINLSSTEACSLAGVAAFGFDTSFDLNGLAPTTGYWQYTIAACCGSPSAGAALTKAFYFSVSSVPGGGTGRKLVAQITTTGSGLVTATSTVDLPATGKNLISVTYTGSALRIHQNGALVASTACTGTVIQQRWERFFIGAECTGPWMGGSDTRPFGAFLALQGSLIGTTRFSIGPSTYVTTPNALSPVYPMVAENTSHVPTPSFPSGVYPTCALISFDVANRSTTICGHSNWIVGTTNSTRSAKSPKNTGYTVWYSMFGHNTTYMPNCKLSNLTIFGRSEAFQSLAIPYLHLDNCQMFGTIRAATLTDFSYFSYIDRGEYYSSVQRGDTDGIVCDNWALALMSEACTANLVKPNGGTHAMVMSGGTARGIYTDIGSDTGIAAPCANDRSLLLEDCHLYSEDGNSAGNVAYLWVTDAKAVCVSGGFFSSIYSTLPCSVSIEGGIGLAFSGTIFSGGTGSPAFSFPNALPARPVSLQGCDGETQPWLDAAHPGPLAGLHSGVATIAAPDANFTLTDNQFFAGYTLKFTGALTADRTITMPYLSVDGWHIQIWNATTGGHNLIVSGISTAPAATTRLMSRGGVMVADT